MCDLNEDVWEDGEVNIIRKMTQNMELIIFLKDLSSRFLPSVDFDVRENTQNC
jgi:hypothetical protein